MSKAKVMLDHIIKEKAQGNTFQELNIQMRLMLKGIPVKNITETTADDPELLSKIRQAAVEFGIPLS